MRSDETTPILVGAGQVCQRDVDFREALEPAALMAKAARLAAADAGLGDAVLRQLDSVAVVSIIGWHYGNAPGVLCEQIHATEARQIYTTIGGNTPQWLVNETAQRIARGETRLALLAGAEAMYSFARARKAKVHLPWSTGGSGTSTVVGVDKQGVNDLELAYGLMMPIAVYPMFENALRAHYGNSIEEHQRNLGALCSGFTQIAADNPHAWFRQARSPAEITTITADNRYIGFPYPKLMNAILDVDQSAAVLMTSVGVARELGIDESRWVYLWGCGDASDIWHVSERVNYFSSPAIRAVGEQALSMAGLGIDDIDYLDIYSCFPSAVQIGRDMLGIATADPRPLTVTGGLPYQGGPGNNYVMHSIATMMDKLRDRPGSKGLVSGLGWYITKHSLGVYSTQPPPLPWQRLDPQPVQAELDSMPHPAVAAEANGRATVETYTVLFGRDGVPLRGIAIGRLENDFRFLAQIDGDRSVLESLTEREGVGRSGVVRSAEGLNHLVLN